ncbi:expression library immunization antigen 1 [Hyaloscypha sp. PMI_1271]|nr:expression library immunization antigen 1 [Hyaloscypha sp. PMI_1271]
MKTTHSLTALAAFASLASAHFNLDYPAARGFDEDTLGTFPCGGQNTVSTNRTSFPISGGSIALTMGAIDANVAVYIGFGSAVGSAFNTVVRPTFTEQGLGNFCMTWIDIPGGSSLEGMQATIQVVTNGDPDGGLYNCADVTLSASASGPASGVCKNGTGVSITAQSISGNPNVTSVSNNTSGKTSGAERGRVQIWGLLLVGLATMVFVW